MKQIITLLFVILVSIPINAQSKQIKQEFENVKRASISRANQFQNDKFRNTQNRNFIVKRKTEYLKSLEKKFLDSLIYQEKVEESNIWRYTNKKIFTYNNDKIDIITVYNWNDITSNWEPFQRDEYTFDVNGNLVKEIRSFQYAPGVWLYGNKTEYSYFINNNNLYDLELEVNSIWDIHTTQWVNANKYELSYDSNMSSLTVELAFEWSTSLFAWVYKSKNEYIPHLLFADFKINSNWNSIENLWDYNTKWEYIRSGMPVTEEIVYNWVSEPTNDWIEDSKIDYEYDYGGPDAFPRQTCETGYSWNNTMNQWETNYKDEY
ncbi:MAG: hypothetical protein KJN66_02125, partial [Bacteroidia bacterium]|nr:hypothetical protein [Bacteroidia bacterium]